MFRYAARCHVHRCLWNGKCNQKINFPHISSRHWFQSHWTSPWLTLLMSRSKSSQMSNEISAVNADRNAFALLRISMFISFRQYCFGSKWKKWVFISFLSFSAGVVVQHCHPICCDCRPQHDHQGYEGSSDYQFVFVHICDGHSRQLLQTDVGHSCDIRCEKSKCLTSCVQYGDEMIARKKEKKKQNNLLRTVTVNITRTVMNE